MSSGAEGARVRLSSGCPDAGRGYGGPAAVNRKVFGGNRTWNGAHVLERQISFFQTCHQQGRDPTALLGDLLRSPDSIIVEALAPSWITEPLEPPAQEAAAPEGREPAPVEEPHDPRER